MHMYYMLRKEDLKHFCRLVSSPYSWILEINLYTCTRLTFSYHQIFEKINMKGANGGARTAYPSRPPEFTPGFLLRLC